MQAPRNNEYGCSEMDPVSPLLDRSGEEFPSSGEVSPLTPPKPPPLAATSSLQHHPPQGVHEFPRRKPIGSSSLHGQGTVEHRALATYDPPRQISSRSDASSLISKDRENFDQRVRSQSVRVAGQQEIHTVPQSQQPHAYYAHATPAARGTTLPTMFEREPRSQTVVPNSRHQPIPLERRICAHCGRPQRETTKRFLLCSKCVNMYYCADGQVSCIFILCFPQTLPLRVITLLTAIPSSAGWSGFATTGLVGTSKVRQHHHHHQID